MRAHLRRRLKTRSPLKTQARLQRPRLPPLLLRQAGFEWDVLGGYLWHRIGRCAWVRAGEMSELGGKSGDGREQKLKTILCAGTRYRVGNTFKMMIGPSSNTAFTAGTET